MTARRPRQGPFRWRRGVSRAAASARRWPALAALLLGAAHAQPVPAPTPGAMADTVNRRTLPQLETPPQVLFSRPAPGARRASTQRFLVSGFTFTGHTVFPEALLRRVVEPYLDLQLTLEELDRVADRITALYRAHGYTVARAVVPAQRVVDGLVTIQVIEGRLEAARFKGASRYGNDFLDPWLEPLVDANGQGPIVNDAALERQLLLLNDLPGLNARGTLVPGERFGGTVLEVETQEKPLGLSVGGNNNGTKETGRERGDIGLEVNNPLRLGDQLQLRAMQSRDGLFRWRRAGYSVALGKNGTRLAVSATETTYRLGGEFEALDIAGQVRSADATLSHPFTRSRTRNVIGAMQWRVTRSEQTVAAQPLSGAKLPVAVASVYANWVRRDSSAHGLSLALTTNMLRRGHDDGGEDYKRFFKVDAEWTYLAGAARNFDVHLRARVARSSAPLPDLERISIGGADSVRGYQPAQLRGDAGYEASFELRRQFLLGNWPGYVSAFADLGGVQNRGFLGWDRMSSVGVGWTHYLGRQAQVSVAVAKPMIDILGRDQPVRAWVGARVSF